MADIASWSTTAALNVLSSGTVGTGGVNTDEGMFPSDVNGAMRDMMARIKAWQTTGVFSSLLTITLADDGAAAGPIINFVRTSASPAASDLLGYMSWTGKDSGGNNTIYADMFATIADPTNGSEDGLFTIRNMVAGTPVSNLIFSDTGLQILAIGATTPGTGAFTTLSATGALTISGASAGQIVFPASQNASAGANTLDDYEEGTWTPTITAGSGTFTTTSASGTYTKIGNRVLAEISITITTNGTAATDVRATLPFTAATTSTGSGRENSATGFMVQGQTSSTLVVIRTHDNLYPGGSGRTISMTIAYAV